MITVDETEAESYGIRVTNDNIILKEYFDVSLSREMVESLVSDLNKYCVEPVHLEDVIEDFYSDNC